MEELRTVVSDSELSDKIVEVENQVAELEEEKGNLQLKLVEYEELAGNYLVTFYFTFLLTI